MKAYFIDSEKREIREIGIASDNSLEELQKLVGGWIEKAWELENRDWFVVNEEGMLNEPMEQNWFVVNGAHQPFAGNGVVVGSDDEGETVDVKTDIETIRAMVRFIDLATIQTAYTILGAKGRRQFYQDLFTTPQAER